MYKQRKLKIFYYNKFYLLENKNLFAQQTSCPVDGYYQDATSQSCIPCHYSCKTCSAGNSATACLTCDTAYRVFDATSNMCLCPQSTYENGASMICSSQTNCDSFNKFKQCVACKPTYQPTFDGKCVSQVRYCHHYTSDGKCGICIDNYFLTTLSDSSQSCVPIKIPEHCSEFKNGKCTKCQNGYVIGANNNCVVYHPRPTCKQNEYVNSQGICVKGNDQKCADYNETGDCQGCKEGNQFDKNGNRCKPILQKNFTKCNNDTKSHKYVVLEDKCTQIDINCAPEGILPTGCFLCKDEYVQYNHTCYKLQDLYVRVDTTGDNNESP